MNLWGWGGEEGEERMYINVATMENNIAPSLQ